MLAAAIEVPERAAMQDRAPEEQHRQPFVPPELLSPSDLPLIIPSPASVKHRGRQFVLGLQGPKGTERNLIGLQQCPL